MQHGIPIPDAATALGVSDRTIRRRIKAGTLTAYEVHTVHGPAWRVVLPAGDGGPDDPDELPSANTDDRLALVRPVIAAMERERAAERAQFVAALAEARQAAGFWQGIALMQMAPPQEALEDPASTVDETTPPEGIMARLRAFFILGRGRG